MARILVVDDEEMLRNNLADILELEGYETLKAENGLVGVQIAREMLPDLILCDIAMPFLDGYGVAQELQKSPTTSSIPLLFLTAKSDHGSVRRAMELGAGDYLAKPFVSHELLSAVRVQLEKRAMMQQQFERQFDTLRGSLMSVLPHELRTPLSIILGYSELVLMDAETLDPDNIKRMVGTILRAGLRLERVIENYLLYAQTEIQRYDRESPNAFSNQQFETPGTLIREVAHQAAQAFNRTHDLVVRSEDETIQVSGDVLKKIVEEIVDNAFKFSDAKTTVDIVGECRGGQYQIRVSDHGHGMSAEQLHQIGAYFQFERKLYEQQGIGLGLILAKRLVELSGGELVIVSEPRQGTTVHITWPLAT